MSNLYLIVGELVTCGMSKGKQIFGIAMDAEEVRKIKSRLPCDTVCYVQNVQILRIACKEVFLTADDVLLDKE